MLWCDLSSAFFSQFCANQLSQLLFLFWHISLIWNTQDLIVFRLAKCLAIPESFWPFNLKLKLLFMIQCHLLGTNKDSTSQLWNLCQFFSSFLQMTCSLWWLVISKQIELQRWTSSRIVENSIKIMKPTLFLLISHRKATKTKKMGGAKLISKMVWIGLALRKRLF